MNPRWRWDRNEKVWRVWYLGHSWTMRDGESWRYWIRDIFVIDLFPQLTNRPQ